MNRKLIRLGLGVVVLVLGAMGYIKFDDNGPGAKRDAPAFDAVPSTTSGETGMVTGSGPAPVLVAGPNGQTNIAATLERIEQGIKHPHKNDGSVFGNYEGRLPKKPRGYYREYVHPTPGINHAGPQRLVIGKNGEVYYTADHYESFVEIEVRE